MTRVVNDSTGTTVIEEERVIVAESNPAERIIYGIYGVIAALLAFRFVLRLLGADSTNGFVEFIYGASLPLVSPFFGIFGRSPVIDGGTVQAGVIEYETLLALAVYGVIAYLLTALFAAFRPKSAR